MDLDEAKRVTAQVWSSGEYRGLSDRLRPAAQALADACAVGAGQEVLDVAAGDGNFAFACAAEGCAVMASDIAPGQVERGRARGEADGFDVEWVQADAEALPFEDERFECVGSVFGVMFAPDADAATRELFRVIRPGNTVGVACWTPESAAVEMFKVAREYQRGPGVDDPPPEELWGTEEAIRARFDGLANSIEFQTLTLPWAADSPEAWVAHMETDTPPQAAAKASMEPDEYAALRQGMLDLARGWAGGDGPFSVDNEYLIAVARRRG